ncbi:GNAT family N-acetyltransferase [Methylocystis hirsuta]|uniref:N-acetyltransferase n=1 Tax=Methylocystis hirsuta TaxID=369798 RepID=A0A3M9XW31_9HYPH|nr:N-acetyltransferase [Methylocystis hirsuta]RNJ51278.1 N-acetyltransferase [Methylocystis hirsuta]
MAFELACPHHVHASRVAPQSRVVPAPFAIRDEAPGDARAREALLDDAFGPARFLKTCQRLRDGSAPAPGLALVATDGVGGPIGTLRLWPVLAGGRAALLLGPLAVSAEKRSLGIGGALIRESLARAADFGHRAVLLVGDAPYYVRFGFERRFTERLTMPGPVERARFLGLELVEGALRGVRGRVVAASTPAIDLPQAA